MEYIEVTIKVHMPVGTVEDAIEASQWMGDDRRKSLLKYVKWMIKEEGLFGVVDDQFDIISARVLREERK